jgi:hypothetical protein
MESQEQPRLSKSIAWIALFAVNLIFGIVFWIGLSTDYKLKNLWADIGFTWFVGTLALISWILVAASILSRSWKTLFSYFVAPSVVGSTPYLFLSILGMWLLFNLDNPPLVDEIESPNHSKIIKAYYIQGIKCGHSYELILHYHKFPILRRDITILGYIPNDVPLCSYENGTMSSSIDTGIEWLDNSNIIVPDKEQGTKVIDIGLIRFHWPVTHARFFVGYIGFLMIVHGIQRLREIQQNEDT